MCCIHVCTCRSAVEHREAVVSDAVEEGAALSLGQQLDFLHKELERLQVCVCVHVCSGQQLILYALKQLFWGFIYMYMYLYIYPLSAHHLVWAGGTPCACIPTAGRATEEDA